MTAEAATIPATITATITATIAAVTAGVTVGLGMYYAAGVPTSQVFGPSLVSAPADGKVALTFDDGPSLSTPAVLDALAEYGATATFFQVGMNALRLPDLAQRVAAEGHEIANHTQHHPRFYLCSPAKIGYEIEQCQESLESVHGELPRLFRPPYGARWFGMYPALDRLGLRSVMWSVSSRDWREPAEAIALRVITATHPGDVVLMHDGDTTIGGDRRQATARALHAILASLRARGLRAVTVSELFALTT
jgi:peptidoglycan/xylan/chitin deacetylase (PgdA/CDA1 family)